MRTKPLDSYMEEPINCPPLGFSISLSQGVGLDGSKPILFSLALHNRKVISNASTYWLRTLKALIDKAVADMDTKYVREIDENGVWGWLNEPLITQKPIKKSKKKVANKRK